MTRLPISSTGRPPGSSSSGAAPTATRRARRPRQCSTCGSTDLRWEPASGRAHLVSWTVVPGRAAGEDPPPAPSILAIGELEEGPWWWTKLIGADPDSLDGGVALRIGFERGEGSEAVPVFELA